MPETVDEKRRICHNCQNKAYGKKANKYKVCSVCHTIAYCGKECQRKDWPRHKENCLPVRVADFPGKGRGLVTSKDIKKGHVILEEVADIVVEESFRNARGIIDQVNKMSEERKSQFYKLKAIDREGGSTEVKIFFQNGRECKGYCALFLNSSLINHSCSPNTIASMETEVTNNVPQITQKVIAIRDIGKGEEITTTYLSVKDSVELKSQRRTILQTVFIDDCQCIVCVGDILDQDEIIKKVQNCDTYLICHTFMASPTTTFAFVILFHLSLGTWQTTN